MADDEIYRFGPFQVIPSERVLLRNGEPISLTPKVFDTLLFLVERRGRLVDKDELMQAVWPDTFVDESNLTQNISVLRKILGRDKDGGRYIETVPKRGYRFVAPGTSVAESASPAHRRSLRPLVWVALVLLIALGGVLATRSRARREMIDAHQIHSLAVLPFRRLDGVKGDNYFGVALADALIDRLGYARRFTVRPTSSVERYAGEERDAIAAGQELGVDAVVDGGIQSSAGRTRVTVQVISIADKGAIWSSTFDEKTSDAFALEDLIGGAVARALVSDEITRAVTPRHRPSPEAYDAYLRGRYYLSRRSAAEIEKAIASFQEALSRDPQFAAAQAGLSESYLLAGLHRMRPPAESMPQAKAAAARALELDPALAEAHACLGATSFYYDYDALNAEREFRRAIELKPAYGTARQWYANYLAASGRFDDALAQIRFAQRGDPQSLMLRQVIGWDLFLARRYDQAALQLRRTLDLDNDFVPAVHTLALVDAQEKKYGEALALLRRESRLGPAGYSISEIARVEALSGARSEAEASLETARQLENERKVLAYDVAPAYAAVGNRQDALAAIRRSFERHEPGFVWLRVDPRLDPLRGDPEFQRLLALR